MRRRLTALAAVVGVVAIVLAMAVRSAGTLDRVEAAMQQALDRDPGVADGWLVVGMTDANTWAPGVRPGASGNLDSDRTRAAALNATVQQLVESGASLVALTELLELEDLVAEDAARFVETMSSGRVLVPLLDAAPLQTQSGRDATYMPARGPLDVDAGLPLAHVVLPPGDGVVRSIPVLRDHRRDERRLRFTTVTAAAALALAEQVDRAASQDLAVRGREVRAGDVGIPVDATGDLRITWSSRLVRNVPGTTSRARWSQNLPFVLAEEVVAGRVPGSMVEGRLVLLGSVDPLGASYRQVPGGPAGGVPGLWVHANALNTLLTDSVRVPAGPVENTIWLMLLAVVGVALTVRLEVGRAALSALLVAMLFLVVASRRMAGGVMVDPLHPLLALALAWLGTFVVRYAVEGRQRRRVATLFKSYVPDTVADQLIEERASLEALAAGQRVDITVVFCDLRGFTAQAATLEPPDVRDLLNVYYRHMATIILGRAGTVMQYVGDEVFAVFGAPLHQDDHAQRALDAAVRMQEAAAEIAQELGTSGIEPISYGIGVHSGSVVAAHVGDDIRRQYSVVGDTVNVGARLCSQAKAGEVVVSEDLLSRLDGGAGAPTADGRPVELERLTDVVMKGVSRDFGIFRLRW